MCTSTTPGAGYGQEASDVLGVAADRVFKTLVAQVDGVLTVGVVPVGSRLDLKALAAAAGDRKAALADPADAERATGYVVGGISPLGQRKRLPVVIDSSALGFGTIFCSGGRRGLEIEIAPGDLVQVVRATVADIAAPQGKHQLTARQGALEPGAHPAGTGAQYRRCASTGPRSGTGTPPRRDSAAAPRNRRAGHRGTG